MCEFEVAWGVVGGLTEAGGRMVVGKAAVV
jgi:hypothetical protein